MVAARNYAVRGGICERFVPDKLNLKNLSSLENYKSVVMTVSVGTFQADQNLYHKHVLPFLGQSLFITFAPGCGAI